MGRNTWGYNSSELLEFRTLARFEAKSIRQHATHPDKNLLKAYHATMKGDNKSAVMFLQLWCLSPNEHGCFRGLETMFKNGILVDLEEDRRISVKEVLRAQKELSEIKSKDYSNYEKKIKEVYEKACRNSIDFSSAMALADTIEVHGEEALESKKRKIGTFKRISNALRSGIIRRQGQALRKQPSDSKIFFLLV